MPAAQDNVVQTDWFYDGSRDSIPLYRSKLPDHLIAADYTYQTLVRFGSTSNSKGQTCVHNRAHAYLIEHKLFSEGTFADPFPISGPNSAMIDACVAHAEANRVVLLARYTAAAVV